MGRGCREREISDMERAMNRTKTRARHRYLPMIKSTFGS